MFLPEYSLPAPSTVADQARLHDEARERASTLRDQARDDFWRGANAVLERGLTRTGRSARRLAARLRRRAAMPD